MTNSGGDWRREIGSTKRVLATFSSCALRANLPPTCWGCSNTGCGTIAHRSFEWRPANSVEDDGLSPQELDALGGVVTGCTVAIAETGTIVLAGGPAEGRRALTLVPDLHVCIVRADQVVETVPEAFAALRGLERRPLTFVSGPSATSDIELKRVEGVHGPRRLVVVIFEA